MRVYFNRHAAVYPADSRVCILTVEGRFQKASVSLQPRLFLFRRWWREFRVTVLGLNLHYRHFGPNPIL